MGDSENKIFSNKHKLRLNVGVLSLDTQQIHVMEIRQNFSLTIET